MSTSYDITPLSEATPPAPPTPTWDEVHVALKDFASKCHVPSFAKVVKGNYMTLGASKFSLSKQHQEVFVHSVKVGVKVLAHCLRRVEVPTSTLTRPGRAQPYSSVRLYSLDQRLAVPISYQGWFELLSEDGKSARPLTSVHELSKVKPEKCLVRENIKAYVISDESKPSFDTTKIVIAGEQLRLRGEFSLPSPGDNKKIKLLRCMDTNNEILYLSFDQKGLFTVIASDRDLTGVFNIRDIVRRFRLPLTVKLVQGVRPKVDPVRFTGLIRLDWVYTDETAFVCPIEKNHVRLLPVPVDTGLQLVSATNHVDMSATDLYAAMMAKCTRMIHNYNNTLHLIVAIPDAANKNKKGQKNVFSEPLGQDGSTSANVRSKQREKRLLDEVDELYGYVRDGGAVPEKVKFTYDSDEESYWEEPAYEPLGEFQKRLMALEAGEKVTYHEKYKPKEPSRVLVDSGTTDASTGENIYGTVWGTSKTPPSEISGYSSPPPLPPRPPDLLSGTEVKSFSNQSKSDNDSSKNSSIKTVDILNNGPLNTSSPPPNDVPPDLPPRLPSGDLPYLHTMNGVTSVSNFGLVSSSNLSVLSGESSTLKRTPNSKKSTNSPTHTPSNHHSPSYRDSPPTHRPHLVHTHSHSETVRFYKPGGPKQQKPLKPSKSSADVVKKREWFGQSRSKSSVDSNSSGGSSKSSSGQRRHLARDFKDSDISSVGRGGSSGGSSGGVVTSPVRKKMQTLYL